MCDAEGSILSLELTPSYQTVNEAPANPEGKDMWSEYTVNITK